MESDVVRDWQAVVEPVTTAVRLRIGPIVKRVTEDIYETVMLETQQYLRDNADYNLKSTLSSLETTIASLREELERLTNSEQAWKIIAKKNDELLAVTESRVAALEGAFKHADEEDWKYLDQLLTRSIRHSQDQQTGFWRSVMREVCKVLHKGGATGATTEGGERT